MRIFCVVGAISMYAIAYVLLDRASGNLYNSTVWRLRQQEVRADIYFGSAVNYIAVAVAFVLAAIILAGIAIMYEDK